MSAAKHDLPPRELNPAAGVAAFLWPGAGHFFIHHQRTRGLAMMIGVLFMVICGLLVGGVSSVDREEQKLWFIAQAGCGPMVFALDMANQSWIKKLPEEERVYAQAIAHPNELGILFIALAGLMNFTLVIDALHHRTPVADRGGGH